MKGRQEEYGGVGITSDGGVRQSSEVSKVRGRVDGVVEIPGESNKEGGIEGKPGGDIGALSGLVDEEKIGNIFVEGDISGSNITSRIMEVDTIALLHA